MAIGMAIDARKNFNHAKRNRKQYSKTSSLLDITPASEHPLGCVHCLAAKGITLNLSPKTPKGA